MVLQNAYDDEIELYPHQTGNHQSFFNRYQKNIFNYNLI